ncbi:Cna B-type domain-containing protein, partial [Bacillus sp. TD10]|uniref:Cna B-type domain-containing protein n=1 Tax=Bacillus sp. TD10 TaxID=1672662 RepID=UPI00391C1FA7
EGNAYKYEVKEQPVDGYKSEVHGYDITNTKVAQTTVEGTKTWKDGNATNRPTTIKVDLLQNGKVIDTKEVSAAGDWKYAFTDLAAYDAEGNAYKYEVKEQPVDGYKSEVHGYDITNTKDPSTDPKDPSTDPKDPSTDPKNPSTDPKDPSTDPKDPSTNPKNPSIQENVKTSVWLPKTGGTSMDMISYIAGMLLLALSGFIFIRQRMR